MDRYSIIFAAAMTGALILGCDDKKTTTDTRTPGQKVESAADKTANVVHEGIEAAGRGLGTIVDKTNDAARTAADRSSSSTQETTYERSVTTTERRVTTTPPPTTQPVVAPSLPQ